MLFEIKTYMLSFTGHEEIKCFCIFHIPVHTYVISLYKLDPFGNKHVASCLSKGLILETKYSINSSLVYCKHPCWEIWGTESHF